MKKLILICVIVTFLTGCNNGASQEKHDEVFKNLQTLRTEHTELKKQYQELEEKHNEISNLYSEYLNLYAETLTSNIDTEYVAAWSKTTFGDDTVCSKLTSNMMQILITMDDVTEENIKLFWNQFLDGLELFQIVYDTVTHDKPIIFIKLINNENNPIMELYFDSTTENTTSNLLVSSQYYELINKSIK